MTEAGLAVNKIEISPEDAVKETEPMYLELEQKKKELETRVEKCLQEKDFKTAKKVSEQLEEVISKM